jgi:hypothetical protein
MANRFTNRKDYQTQEYLDRSFKISNGYTDHFIAALALSTSEFAETECEINLAMWITSRDQYRSGIGTVGFDISDMPWSVKSFDEQMVFMLRAVNAAKSARYFAENPFLYEDGGALDKFRALLQDFSVEFVKPEATENWERIKPERQKCTEHGVYLNWSGCIVCHVGKLPD